MTNKKNYQIYAAICLIALGLGIIWSIKSHHGQSAREDEPVVRINDTTVEVNKEAMANFSITKAKVVDFPDTLDVMGRVSVTEDRTTNVPARVAGRTDAVYVPSGATVQKGQVLLSLFSPDFAAAKEEYLQSLKQSKKFKPVDHDSDFADLTRMARKKLENMGVSDEEIDSLASNDSKNQNLIIRAPRSGIIMSKNAVIGNLVNVGDTLFTIADLSKVWFTGDLYPEDLSKVHKGQDVIIDTVDGERIEGVVSFISPVVDPTARTIKIRALMDNPKYLLKADMYVHGSLILQKRQLLVIPTRALTRVEDKFNVFKMISDNQFQKIDVTVGGEQGAFTAVEKGLHDGDRIISDGGALLLNAALESVSR